ncbi:MAG: ABC-2 transporter permease [Clostridia bacterium]|nr:ABC-2 transporter permease [Clostridia bacterium]
MRGLLLKDLINLKTYGRSVILIVTVFTAFAFFSDDSSFTTTFISILFAIMAITSMSYDELAKWNIYALSMPISRKELVLEKYLLAFILVCLGVAISLIIAVIPVFMGNKADLLMLMLTVLTSGSVALIMLTILLPLVYKFGIEKSRIILFIVLFIPSILLAILAQTGLIMPNKATDLLIITLLQILPIVALVLFVASYFISVAIFNNKEI